MRIEGPTDRERLQRLERDVADLTATVNRLAEVCVRLSVCPAVAADYQHTRVDQAALGVALEQLTEK